MYRRSAVTACLLVLTLLASAATAATPESGTVSESNPIATWSGNPQPPTASATCNGPNDPACDNFRLSILPPSFGFSVEITITPTGGDDYDLQVYDPAGQLIASSGNSPGQPESATLVAPAAGTYTVSVANFAAALAYAGRAEIVALDPGDPPNVDGGPTFALYPAPGGLGTNAGEPSVGINWNTDRVMTIAGLQTLRVEYDDCSSPADSMWTDVSFTTTGVVTLDPILFTDPITGRTFASQLGPKCSAMAFTDDDGENWIPSQGCGINSGVDHQSVGGGRFADPLTRDPDGPLYPHAVYYCSQDVALAQCARSDTGGLTFNEAAPIYAINECGGLHGHVKIAPDDGAVYVPNKNCGGEQAVAVSDPDGPLGGNGIAGTWEVRRVPGTTSGEWDPSVGIGADGTLYLGMTNGGRPMVAVSVDKGFTWSTPFDVGVGVGPTGGDILNTAFPVVVAGDGDRAAFGFLGAEQGGDGGGEDPNSGHVWYPYVAVTYDRGLSWTTVNLSPDDPVQRGTICSGGTLCGGTRNLLDFNDVAVDREGRIVFAYADGCIDDCVKQEPNSASELLTLARQKGGQRLFAAFDFADVPAAPRASAEFTDEDQTQVLVSWEEPDDRGSPILAYRVYRRFEGGTGASLLAEVDAATFSLEDVVAPGDRPLYRVTAVNAFGEGASCTWLVPAFMPPENACVEPGIGLLADPSGDALTMQDEHDVRSLHVSQPTDLGDDLFLFTLEMQSLASPPPNTTWPVVFTGADGNPYFVKMATDAIGTVSFQVGTGTNPSVAGAPADPASSFDADGTIRIVVPGSAIGSPQIGDQLTGFLTRIRVEVPGGSALTPDNMPDSLAPSGSYAVADCNIVEHCADEAFSDPLHGGRSDHAFWLPGIGKDFIFKNTGDFVEFPDGTAMMTGTLVDQFDVDRRFRVEVFFADKTDQPPPGSPKKELRPEAYVENGGPIDPATWVYYPTMSGMLFGENDFAGARIQLTRRGAAFQVGAGANGKNAVFGGSGWLNWIVDTQPDQGEPFASSGWGDINVNLECSW